LDARTHVWNLTQGKLLLSPPTAHVTDNYQSSMYTDTDGKLDTFGLLQMGIEVSHGSKDAQTSSDSSLGIIFMGLGIPKVHQESITKELGDMTIKVCDDLGTDLLICTYNLSQVLRIKLSGQGSGIDQVAEHHGELAAFGVSGAWGSR
jgi:hypothetical protein